MHTLDENTRTQFNAAIGAGFKKVFSLSGSGQVTVVGQDNEAISFNVSEDTARAFAKDQAQVRSESLQQTINDTQGLDYITNMAKQVGATEAYTYLNSARAIRSSTESYGADLTTALVKNYASERYGSESPENIRHAINDFNHFLTQQGRQGVNNMHDIVNGFVSGNGYGWGNTTSEIDRAINSTSGRILTGRSTRGAVNQASGTATAMTSDIKPSNFSAPNSDIPMQAPNEGAVLPNANSLRSYNRNEEAGGSTSRIRTTASGMAKEGVGNIFQGQGLVDSQTERATGEGFFGEPPLSVKGDNLHEPGPMPQKAQSTLGKEKREG